MSKKPKLPKVIVHPNEIPPVGAALEVRKSTPPREPAKVIMYPKEPTAAAKIKSTVVMYANGSIELEHSINKGQADDSHEKGVIIYHKTLRTEDLHAQ